MAAKCGGRKSLLKLRFAILTLNKEVPVGALQGDSWMVQAKFHYRDQDFLLPLTLPIRWAGDTPVISLDEFPVPGLGKFDARVMIYQDHYAGFWSGAGHSGHIFGKVERTDDKPSE